MPAFSADLHNHTPASADYRRPETTPREIVEAALGAGLHVCGMTDHFSCGLGRALIDAADAVASDTGRRLLVVSGAELRITFRGDEAHITALYPAEGNEALFQATLGILGITSPMPAHEDMPFFTWEHDPVDVCRIIEALGGIAMVSHADRAFGDYRLIDSPLFWRLAEEPAVSAIDFLDPESHRDLVSGLRPSIIQCSDSHCCDDIGSRRSLVAMEELSFDSLKAALAAGAVLPEVLV